MKNSIFQAFLQKSLSKKPEVTFFLCFILCAGTSYAAFEDIGIGARPMGMGGAFVALADDAYATSYNPAGLGYVKNFEAGFTRINMFSGAVNYNYSVVAIPMGSAGGLGFSFGMLKDESSIYSENTGSISYSRLLVEKLSLGANIKMLSTGFDDSEWVKDNPYFVETSTSGFTFDVGILAKPVKGLSIGLVGQNLIPVNVSVSESEEDKVPMNLRFGAAYNLAPIAANAQQPVLKEVLETTTISVEVGSRKERETNALKARAGIEAWFANQILGLRAGYNMKKVQDTSSSVCIGASIRVPLSGILLRLDYAAQIFGSDLQDRLAHRISFGLSF